MYIKGQDLGTSPHLGCGCGPTMTERSMARQAAGFSSGIGGEAAGLAATLPPLDASCDAAADGAAASELLGAGERPPPGKIGDKLGCRRLLSDGCTGLIAAEGGATCTAAKVLAPPP